MCVCAHAHMCMYMCICLHSICVLYRNGWTALLWASFNGLAAMIHVLLDAGARVDVTGNNRDTALLWASSCGQLEARRVELSGLLEFLGFRAVLGDSCRQW